MTRCPFCDKVVPGEDADTPIVEHLWEEHMRFAKYAMEAKRCAVCGVHIFLGTGDFMCHLSRHGGLYQHLLRHALHGKDKRGTNDDAVPGV